MPLKNIAQMHHIHLQSTHAKKNHEEYDEQVQDKYLLSILNMREKNLVCIRMCENFHFKRSKMTR